MTYSHTRPHTGPRTRIGQSVFPGGWDKEWTHSGSFFRGERKWFLDPIHHGTRNWDGPGRGFRRRDSRGTALRFSIPKPGAVRRRYVWGGKAVHTAHYHCRFPLYGADTPHRSLICYFASAFVSAW